MTPRPGPFSSAPVLASWIFEIVTSRMPPSGSSRGWPLPTQPDGGGKIAARVAPQVEDDRLRAARVEPAHRRGHLVRDRADELRHLDVADVPGEHLIRLQRHREAGAREREREVLRAALDAEHDLRPLLATHALPPP